MVGFLYITFFSFLKKPLCCDTLAVKIRLEMENVYGKTKR